jgi:integral membrane protein
MKLNRLSILKIVAILEGISYLLFAVTVPLKKIYNYHWPNKIVGMSHGILFILYMLLVFINSKTQTWSWKTKALLYLASVIPFGTFIVEKKILNNEQRN